MSHVTSLNVDIGKFSSSSYTYSLACATSKRISTKRGGKETEATAVFESSVTVRIAGSLVRTDCHEMIGTRPCHLCEFCVTNLNSLSFPSFSLFYLCIHEYDTTRAYLTSHVIQHWHFESRHPFFSFFSL